MEYNICMCNVVDYKDKKNSSYLFDNYSYYADKEVENKKKNDALD